MEVTPAQRQVLEIIATWFNTHQRSPSLGEIARQRAKGGQLRSVVQLLDYLKAKGYIDRKRGRHRSIVILPKGSSYLEEVGFGS